MQEDGAKFKNDLEQAKKCVYVCGVLCVCVTSCLRHVCVCVCVYPCVTKMRNDLEQAKKCVCVCWWLAVCFVCVCV